MHHHNGDIIHCNCSIGNMLARCESVTISMIGNDRPYAITAHFAHDSKIHKVERLYFLCDDTSPGLGFIGKNPDVFFNSCFVEMTPPSPAVFKPDPSLFVVSGEGTANILTDRDKMLSVASMIMHKHPSRKAGAATATADDDSIGDVTAKTLLNSALVSIEIITIVAQKVPLTLTIP